MHSGGRTPPLQNMVYVDVFGHPQGMPLQKTINHTSNIINHTSNIKTMENKSIWGKILHIVITVLTAIATTFGVSSCMGV